MKTSAIGPTTGRRFYGGSDLPVEYLVPVARTKNLNQSIVCRHVRHLCASVRCTQRLVFLRG